MYNNAITTIDDINNFVGSQALPRTPNSMTAGLYNGNYLYDISVTEGKIYSCLVRKHRTSQALGVVKK